MQGKRRFASILALWGVLFLVFVGPAMATEESDEPEPAPIGSDSEPAVVVTTPPASDATLDWTYRYIIPAGLVIAALVIVVTAVQYFTQVVRKRYRIVEE